MINHLHFSKRFLPLLITIICGIVGITNLNGQISEGAVVGGVFTINSSGQKVFFSQGNLQYIGSASTPYWKFADNQWDYLGTTTGQNSSNENVDRDLFGWGTSGYNHGPICYQPWSTSTTNSQYYGYHNLSGQSDWGYNAISNGGNAENSGWYTLSKNQWFYVFNTRTASEVNGTSNARYAKAKVANVQGVILFPDSYTHPASVAQPTGINETGNTGWDGNNYNAVDFALMQDAGAVFLPAAGSRNGTTVSSEGSFGGYWSTSYSNSSYGYYVYFNNSNLNPDYTVYYYLGRSVRLVCLTQNYSFNINATPSPVEGGTVSGEGTYAYGADCTLTATPSAGFEFANWMENGTIVSTEAAYTFSVTGNRSLVANFMQEGNITFADDYVKSLCCVYYWDTNGDGELSYAEAANITSLGTRFKNKTSIHSFNELQFFINLGSIGEQAFYGCTGLTQITIPEAVTSVGNQAFYGCTGLTQITIPEAVTSVGNQAFWNCPALQTVRFNAVNCTSMQTTYNNQTYSVFSSDASGGAPAVKSVIIANGVTRIPAYAFKDCAQIYPGMTIRSSVTEIGAHAFENCSSMTTLSFQSNSTLAVIGAYAFSGCSALNKALNLPNSITTLGQYAFYGCVAIPSLTIGTSMSTIGAYAFWNCPAMTTVYFNAVNCTQMCTLTGNGTYSNPIVYYSVFNSDTSNGGVTPIVTLTIGNNVTRIPDYAFRNSTNMTSVITIPDVTTYIGQYAFYGAQTPELTIGEGIATIGGYAFWNCPNLATVHFNATNCTSMAVSNKSVFNIGTSDNGTSPVVTLTIGDNVTRIPDYAFKNSTNMSSTITIPNATTYIGKYAFYGAQTPELTIGEGIATIGGYAFWNCPNLATVHFNATNCTSMVTDLQYSVFNTSTSGPTPIVTLTIGDNVTRIPGFAFRNSTHLTGAITIPDATTSIGGYAFYGARTPELTIGEGIATIGGYAFWNCPNLATVHFNATNCTSMVTNSEYSVFNTGTSNNGATPIVALTIGDNVTRIPNYAFRNSTNMTGNLIIPNSVTNIGAYAFSGCSSLTGDLVFHNTVTNIGQYAFQNCSGFNGTLTLPINELYTKINDHTFDACSGLTGVLTVPANVTQLGEYVFSGCGFIGSLVLHDAIITIGSGAFNNCNGLTGDLVIPNSVTSLGSYAFSDCSGFNGSLILGNGIQSINQNTFAGCTGFSGALILGTQVDAIADNAFNNCSAFSLLITENADPITATSSSFTGMTYTIPVYVPDGLVSNYQNATGWSSFTNYVEQYTFWQELDTDNWSDELNWLSMEVPSANDVVCVTYNCDVDIDVDVLHVYVYNINDVLTVKSGKTLNTTYGIGVVQPSQLVMEEGSQLYNTIPGVSGTVKKQITGYGTSDNGWFTIAAPVYAGMPVSTLATGNYDLYAYDEPTAMWLNQKDAANDFTTLNPAQGYLYASQTGRTANLAGQLNPSNAEISIPVTYTSGELAGFNLVGNPYTNNISIGNVKINGTAQTAFYRAEGGSSFVAYVAADNVPIKPGDGFMVKATEEGTLTFGSAATRGEEQQDDRYVRLVLSRDGQVADRAYLRMNEGQTMEKFSTTTAHSQLYFKNSGNCYAVAANEAEDGVMPLYLEKANGTYTIEAALLNTEFDYLHLVDNLTGADIDLLETPSYTFTSKPNDYASRFKLVFDAQQIGSENNQDGFAFVSNGDLIVNGTGTLQVIDVNGRVISSNTVSNHCSINGMTSGVYVLRLVNNDNVKIQKIVIK